MPQPQLWCSESANLVQKTWLQCLGLGSLARVHRKGSPAQQRLCVYINTQMYSGFSAMLKACIKLTEGYSANSGRSGNSGKGVCNSNQE